MTRKQIPEFTAKDRAICGLAELVRDMHKEMTDVSTTTIPGLKSSHQKITPTCRANRGDLPAFLEAQMRLEEAYRDYALAPENANVTWHLVLVREEGELP